MFRIHTNAALYFSISIFCVITQTKAITNDSFTPIVLWHGMGDSCCFSFSMGYIRDILTDKLPGVYIKSIRIGNNELEDVTNSYFGNINEQIKHVCNELNANDKLKNGYNAIGFSQGAQFLRAIAQRCPNPPMLNFISFGGQHQGVYGIPNCASLNHAMCDYIRRMLNYGAYFKLIQEKLIQAGYWHNPLQEDEYKHYNLFLADINNELNINETYKTNLKNLMSIVLVKFDNDTMVQPIESEWFGFYKPGQNKEIESLQESSLYQEDRLGLQEMDMLGKIHFLSVEGNHLQFTDTWFIENIVEKYLM